MSLSKVHKIDPHAVRAPGWVKTFCGRIGHKDSGPNEYVTDVNGRFEATAGREGVTCQRCRQGRWDRTDGRI
jgi:hypothetical protein